MSHKKYGIDFDRYLKKSGTLNTDLIGKDLIRKATATIPQRTLRTHARKVIADILQDERFKAIPWATLFDIGFTIALIVGTEGAAIPALIFKKLIIELGIREFIAIGTNFGAIRREVYKYKAGKHTADNTYDLAKHVLRVTLGMKTLTPYQISDMAKFLTIMIRHRR